MSCITQTTKTHQTLITAVALVLALTFCFKPAQAHADSEEAIAALLIGASLLFAAHEAHDDYDDYDSYHRHSHREHKYKKYKKYKHRRHHSHDHDDCDDDDRYEDDDWYDDD